MLDKINHPPKEFKVGFFGWFIYANIVFVAIAVLMIGAPSLDGIPLVLMGIWVPTAITLTILFAKKRAGVGNGILTAVTVNTIIVGVNSGAFFNIFRGYISHAILSPMPAMYIAWILAIMDMMSPPYTLTNLSNLLLK